MGPPLFISPEERARTEASEQANTLTLRPQTAQTAQGSYTSVEGQTRLNQLPAQQNSANNTSAVSSQVNIEPRAQPAASSYSQTPIDLIDDGWLSDPSEVPTVEDRSTFGSFYASYPSLRSITTANRGPQEDERVVMEFNNNASSLASYGLMEYSLPETDLQAQLTAAMYNYRASRTREPADFSIPPLYSSLPLAQPSQPDTIAPLPANRISDYMLTNPEDLMERPEDLTLPQLSGDRSQPMVFAGFDRLNRRPQDITHPGAQQSGSRQSGPSIGNQEVIRGEISISSNNIADLAGPMIQHIEDIRSHRLPKYYELCESYGHILWRWCQAIHHDASMLCLGSGPDLETLLTLRNVFWDIGRRWRSRNTDEIAIAIRDISNFLMQCYRYSRLPYQSLEEVPLLRGFAEILLQEGMERERMLWDPLVTLHVGCNLNYIRHRMSESQNDTSDQDIDLDEDEILYTTPVLEVIANEDGHLVGNPALTEPAA